VIKVLLVDDQALVRSGFRMILESKDDLEVIGEAADGREAVELAQVTSPDVILMDVRMPELDGVEATRRILEASSSARVIILTTFDLDEYVFEAIRAGASGFLLKDVRPAELVDAIRVVAAGEALLAPSVTRRLIEGYVGQPEPRAAPNGLDELTARELEVLRLVARGDNNREIADALQVSPLTAKTHVSRILMKLGARDRVQLVVTAYRAGLVDPRG
jgi:DNA-binding NarL/FixJ family response regulator